MSKSLPVRPISLPCFGMEIRLVLGGVNQPCGGTIASDLHAGGGTPADRPYNAAVDGLGTLILAHACAGMDVDRRPTLRGSKRPSRRSPTTICKGVPDMFRTRVGTAIRITDFNPAKARPSLRRSWRSGPSRA